MYHNFANGQGVPDPQQAAWVIYRLRLAGFTLRDIATKAQVTPSVVSAVICGRRTSAPVRQVIVQTMGCADWDEVIRDERRTA